MTTFLKLKTEDKQMYEHTEDELDFVNTVWREFHNMHALKTGALAILDGRTLQEYWDDSVRDYGILSTSIIDENDPVKQYQSTVSRDKADVFISDLTSQLLFPDVIAQNIEQEIDYIMSRVGSSILEWAHKNDGWPGETGQEKNTRYIKKAVIEGTCHVLDVITKDGLDSEMIPNEEVYIKNYWQTSIQKQPIFIRARVNLTFDEAELLFGDNEKWKYVEKGAWMSEFLVQNPALKDGFDGIDFEETVQVLYVWKLATPDELKELKKIGKIRKKTKRACFYNVLINNIPLYPVDNLSPYKHGFYPISKMIFTNFAKSEFYWGNSAPNKIKEDKRWLDAWKTLLRFKGKLGVLKPSLIYGGSIDDDIILPSKMTEIEQGVEIRPIEGVADGVSQADITLLQMAEGEIDRGTVSPQVAGQQTSRKETARATVISAANSERLLDSISQNLGFFQTSRSFHILLSMFQFIPKRDIKKIAVPDQTLQDGLRGNFEIIFESSKERSMLQTLEDSMEIYQQEKKSRESGTPKEIVYVNTDYLDELNYYVTADASNILQTKSIQKAQAFESDMPLMYQMPDLYDRKEVSREHIKVRGYSTRLLAKAPEMPQGGGLAQMMGGKQQPRQPPQEQMMNETAEAMTGQGLPALPTNV